MESYSNGGPNSGFYTVSDYNNFGYNSGSKTDSKTGSNTDDSGFYYTYSSMISLSVSSMTSYPSLTVGSSGSRALIPYVFTILSMFVI